MTDWPGQQDAAGPVWPGQQDTGEHTWGDTAKDVGLSALSGVPRGMSAFLGAAGDVRNLASAGIDYLGDKLGINPATIQSGKERFGQAARLTEMGNVLADAPTSGDVRGGIEKVTGPLHEGDTTAGKFAGAGIEAASNPASYIGPGGLVGKGIGALVSGLGGEAGAQLAEGTGHEGAARFAGSVLGGMLPRGAARTVAGMEVPADRAANAAILRREGVEPTAGELTGNRALRTAEDELGNLPGAGGAFHELKEQQLRNYTRAVVRHIGVDADNALPETINRARDMAAAGLERAARGMRIRMDARLGDDLHNIRADLMREGATPDQINRINQQLENLQTGFVTQTRRHNGRPDTIMDGATYQGLTRHGTPLGRAIDDMDPTVSYYATRIRSALDDAMERTALGRGTRAGRGLRQSLEDLRTARRIWYNQMIISQAVTGPGELAPAGLVSPQKLRGVLTTTQDRKLQYAAGRGNLAEIARAGEGVMQPIATSNTSARHFARSIPSTIGAAAGAALGQRATGEPISGALLGMLGPGMAGRALLSRPAQSYLKAQLPGQAATRRFLNNSAGIGTQALRAALAHLGSPYGGMSPPSPYAEGGSVKDDFRRSDNIEDRRSDPRGSHPYQNYAPRPTYDQRILFNDPSDTEKLATQGRPINQFFATLAAAQKLNQDRARLSAPPESLQAALGYNDILQ